MLGEPGLGQAHQVVVAQWLPRARGHLVDGRLLGRALGGDGEDRGHDEVHRYDVDDTLGHTGKLSQQSARVGDDHGLGHAKSPDPSRMGLGQR